MHGSGKDGARLRDALTAGRVARAADNQHRSQRAGMKGGEQECHSLLAACSLGGCLPQQHEGRTCWAAVGAVADEHDYGPKMGKRAAQMDGLRPTAVDHLRRAASGADRCSTSLH